MMPRVRTPLITLAAAGLAAASLAATGVAPAAAGPAKAGDSATVTRIPGAGRGRHQSFRVDVTTLHSTYGGSFVLKTKGPRPGCPTRRVEYAAGGDMIEAGENLRFTLKAPAAGWCRGRQTVTLLLHDSEDVSSPYDTCETPESGSSQCEGEYEPVVTFERRFGFRVR